MTILVATFGLGVGSLLTWASVVLPRFSASRPDGAGAGERPHRCALWHVAGQHMLGQRPDLSRKWVGLDAGVELLTAVTAAYLWERFGFSWNLALFGLTYAFLVLIAIIDFKYRLVLNVLTYPAIVGMLAYHYAFHRADFPDMLLGGGLAFAMFFAVAAVRPGGLGMGDVKLATLLGVAFGFPHVLIALMVGVGLGGLVALTLLLSGRAQPRTHMPYAPFLSLGALAVILYDLQRAGGIRL